MNSTSLPGKGLEVKRGYPALRKLAKASGPFIKDDTQYCVLIISNAFEASNGFAAKYASAAAGAMEEPATFP